MKVNNQSSTGVEQTGTIRTENLRDVKEKKKTKTSGTSATESAEKVSVSTAGKETAKAKKVATAAPDTDEAKIARIKQAMANGSYKVDADKIADRLVDEHLKTTY